MNKVLSSRVWFSFFGTTVVTVVFLAVKDFENFLTVVDFTFSGDASEDPGLFFSVAVPGEADFGSFTFWVDPRGTECVGFGILPSSVDIFDEVHTDFSGGIPVGFTSFCCLDIGGLFDPILVASFCGEEGFVFSAVRSIVEKFLVPFSLAC